MNYTSLQNRLALVKQEVKKIQGARVHERYTMVKCPYHSDANPSGCIYHSANSRTPGFFKCFGCGAKASWDEVAPLLGCQPFESKPQVRYANSFSFSNDSDLLREEKLHLSELPKNKLWRSISTNLLRKIGCKICTVNDWPTKFIYMPVIIDGETVGYTKGRLRKEEGKTSYINLAGPWAKTHGLFPFDYAISKMTDTKTVVLVEGQRDALRLLSNGIPAMCIMGTQSFSESKCRLLEMHGVERCVILMDGDEAGIKGTHKVHSYLSKFLDCVVLKLWKMRDSPYLQVIDEESPSKRAKELGLQLWDPGNCPQWILDKLKEKYL